MSETATPPKRGRGRPVEQKYELDGVIMSVPEWADRLDVHPSTLRRRLSNPEWTLRDCLTRSSRKRS